MADEDAGRPAEAGARACVAFERTPTAAMDGAKDQEAGQFASEEEGDEDQSTDFADFCHYTGLSPSDVDEWIGRQVRMVRRMERGGRVRCGIVPARRPDFQVFTCDFQSEDGNYEFVSVSVSRTTALYISGAGVPDAVSALELIGFVLEELDLPVWIDL